MQDPFATPPSERTPIRRFRGRLAAPVTVWTAGDAEERTGLTVSSVLVAEGEPPMIAGLIAETSDLWDVVQKTRAFGVHILSEDEHVLAERFAGLRPSPGGLFADLDTEDTEWGPLLRNRDRAACRFVDAREFGYYLLVRGTIERIELTDDASPLIHLRGRFRKVAD